MYGHTASLEQLRRELASADNDDDITFSMPEFLAAFGQVIVSQLRIRIWIQPVEHEQQVHPLRVKLFGTVQELSLIHISEPTRLLSISYAVFCLKKKKSK
eukprot:TRINITY_DN48846_c0_g1_i3.p2 TRINITY_DN48846_c0_g1~~TRINITY_DN48846_c0_g1_i3.p2  ORF type:complete len:100 (+),score=29.78 TRINITY_DN48846_c0_g1_i3:172-471(+)